MAKKGRRFRLSKETTEEVSPSPIVFVQRGRGDCHYPVARVAACRWDVTICIRMPHTALRLSAGHNSPCQGRARGQAGCDPGSSGHGCCPADPSKMTHTGCPPTRRVATISATTRSPSAARVYTALACRSAGLSICFCGHPHVSVVGSSYSAPRIVNTIWRQRMPSLPRAQAPDRDQAQAR
jgi:hypothetical protein